MKNANFIIYDCETGGLDAEKNPITQIAMLAIDGKTLKEINRFETFVKPYNDLVITKDALDATGLKISDIKNGLEIKKVVRLIEIFIKEVNPNNHPANRSILVGHNVQFDNQFLNYAFNLVNKDLSKIVSPTSIDTMALAKLAFPKIDSLSLGSVAEKIGVDLIDAHKAMNDVLATAKVFKKFINRLRSENTHEMTEDDEAEKRIRNHFPF